MAGVSPVRLRRPSLWASSSGGELVSDDFDLPAENALLLGESEDLLLEDLAISAGLGPHRLAVGTCFVADSLNIAAYAGDAGEGERGQGDAHTEDGESFLAGSGHVGAYHDEWL